MAETRIQTVKDLAASRFDWEQALRDISRAIPNDVTLTSLNGSISSGANSGGGSAVRGAIDAPAVTLQGCTTGQKQVATLLSRLRAVDGVTRVTLTKSTKPQEQASNAAAPAANTLQTGCGSGRPPAFEVVLFFERSTVPSSVDDITVATGGSAAGSTSTAPETTKTTSTSGVTTPPADPAASPTATPQGGDSK
jgi:hypothetical protein